LNKALPANAFNNLYLVYDGILTRQFAPLIKNFKNEALTLASNNINDTFAYIYEDNGLKFYYCVTRYRETISQDETFALHSHINEILAKNQDNCPLFLEFYKEDRDSHRIANVAPELRQQETVYPEWVKDYPTLLKHTMPVVRVLDGVHIAVESHTEVQNSAG